MRKVLTVLAVVALGLVGCGERESKVPTAEALPYQVLKKETKTVELTKGGKRTSAIWAIYADGAKTVKQRVHTALKAAMDAQAETKSDYAEAHLLAAPNAQLMGTGKLLALGQYAPDGVDGSVIGNKLEHGQWEARATDYQLQDRERQIITLWYENRARFDRKGPFGLSQVDEPAIKAFIGKELGIPADQVEMKLWQTYKYFPE